METKCLDAIDSVVQEYKLKQFTPSASTRTTTTLGKTIKKTRAAIAEQQLENQPSTSLSSMALLQEDFGNSQPDFAEVLDEETTTSGVLETFEISSSNSMPGLSDAIAADVAADDSSSTDTIKLVEVSDVATSNNEFYQPAEVFVINDDDDEDDEADVDEADDDDDDDVGNDDRSRSRSGSGSSVSIANSSSMMLVEKHKMNSVIMTTGGNAIFLETPVVDEQQHHQQLIAMGELEYTEKQASGKPKRLSDEFLLADDLEPDTSVNADNKCSPSSSGGCSNTNNPSPTIANCNLKMTESPDIVKKSASCSAHGVKNNAESHPDKMSFRLKKMNISNTAALTDFPSSSHNGVTMSEIESMDLIERRDFETEQRLTGGIIMKSNSLINKNMLNLSLIKSCMQPQKSSSQKEYNDDDINNELPSSSNTLDNERPFSSDSKCAYNPPQPTTPRSSRTFNSRLTKSTVKLNLCSTLSHLQSSQQQQQQGQQHENQTNGQSSSGASISTGPPISVCTSSLSSSVIVEAPSTSANASNSTVANAAEIFSNSNSNDSLVGGGNSATIATVKNCQHEKTSLASENGGGCSRTNATSSVSSGDRGAAVVAAYDDARPSTSSARCQYALPPKVLRQVHASAQTNERYLTRSNTPSKVVTSASLNGAALAANGGGNVSNSVISGGGGGIGNPTIGNRTRRRNDPTAHLTRNSTSEEVIAAFKVVVAEAAAAAAAAAERGEFNEDSWADCEESNSDLEEICTCRNNSDDSSHGGSNSSLNETEEQESSLGVCNKDGGGDLSNYIGKVSISEEEGGTGGGDGGPSSFDCNAASTSGIVQRKRKYDSRLVDSNDSNAAVSTTGGSMEDSAGRKRIAYDFASAPRSEQSSSTSCSGIMRAATPSSQLSSFCNSGSPIGRRTPRSLIPTRDNPPPELQNWLTQFQRWSHVERLVALDRLIEHCEPTQVRHMMKVIEPQFQRDFISLLPRELALQVLAYLDPKDLLRAAQTCRSWRYLCDDNLLWKEKCRKSQILTDRPKRSRAGTMPSISSPWKAAYMRQHIIEMNWRSRPIREPKVLKGHDDHVITCLQFSGNRIVSGSDDNTLKVWSAVTGKCLRTLVGHTGGVWSSQMSGNIIISGSTDRTLKVWDLDTGHCVHTLMGHTSTVRCMHLHGTRVVSGSRDASLRVWDIELGSCLHILVGHLAAVRCVQYDGKLIVSGAYDYMVKVWLPERQECLHTLQGHTNRVYSLQFDGAHVVSGSLDTSIRVWDVETGNCKHTLMGHQSLTSGMELRQNILVSGNADSTVKVWDITTGQCLQTLSGPNKHQSAVTCLQFNSRFVVTSSDDGTVKLWDVKTGDFIRNLVALDSGGSGGVVWRIRANDTKLICAVGSRNGTEETKLMVLDFDVEGACSKCS